MILIWDLRKIPLLHYFNKVIEVMKKKFNDRAILDKLMIVIIVNPRFKADITIRYSYKTFETMEEVLNYYPNDLSAILVSNEAIDTQAFKYLGIIQGDLTLKEIKGRPTFKRKSDLRIPFWKKN